MKDRIGIEINQIIHITRAGDHIDDYVAKVQDLDEHNFYISVPSKGPNSLILRKGDRVKVSFISEECRFLFNTKMMGLRNENIMLYALAIPEEYERVQQRAFYRLPIIMEVNYAIMPEEGKNPVFVKSESLDLSGNGMKIVSKNDYAPDTMLLLKFNLPFKNGPVAMEVTGQVQRSWLEENAKRYNLGVKFVNMSLRQEDSIVRFVLTKTVEQNRLR